MEENEREGEWSVVKVRIWQCAIKSTGMPQAQDALDSLINAYCKVLAERNKLEEEIEERDSAAEDKRFN